MKLWCQNIEFIKLIGCKFVKCIDIIPCLLFLIDKLTKVTDTDLKSKNAEYGISSCQ